MAVTGLAQLLVNFEGVTLKSKVGGVSKNCVGWKIEKAVQYCVHTKKATTDSSTD